MRRFTVPLATILTATTFALSGCAGPATAVSDPTRPITFATVPLGDDPTAANPIEVFAELFEESTGRKVEVREVPDYLSVVEALRAGHVDMGMMSGFPSALAVATGEVDALVAFGGDGKPVSTCVVLEGSPVTTLADLRGKTVAFADQASSSGYFMPVYMLHQAGLERGVDYQAIFAGGHEGSFAALKQGQVDAACTAIVLTELGEPMFPFKDGEWRGVGQSPSVAVSGALLGRQDLDEATRTLIEQGVVAAMAPENADRLDAMAQFAEAEKIIDPDPSLFAQFTEIAAVAGVQLKDLT